MKLRYLIPLIILSGLTSCIETSNKASTRDQIVAKGFKSGELNDQEDVYNGLSTASDNKIYYILATNTLYKGAEMYVYNPENGSIKILGDLTEICGEGDKKTVPQGKSHVKFYEFNNKLYFATHLGYYEFNNGLGILPENLPEGYSKYPGGHFLSYDLDSGTFEDLGIGCKNEGILTMTMDTVRGKIYAISWPSGYFIHYDVNTGIFENHGLYSLKGEAGEPGKDYRVLCRAMFVDNTNGKAYFSTAEGDIFYYDPVLNNVKKMEDVNLRIDYFGKFDPSTPGNMCYNWRQIVWNPDENVAYGVHGNSGYLFRFDPENSKIEIIERITSVPSRKSGMFDQYKNGYLSFDLSPDHKAIYYLTGGPVEANQKTETSAKKVENIHFVTYQLDKEIYTDYGPIFFEDGSRPTLINSIAIIPNGKIYALARFEYNGKEIVDLIAFSDPGCQ